MGLLDLFGGGSGGDAASQYDGILSPQQQQAISGRGLMGFLQAAAPYMGYSRMPVSFGQMMAAGAGGMGAAQDTAALNALKLALGGKELTGKDLANQLEALNLKGWLNAQGGSASASPGAQQPSGADSSAVSSDAAASDTVEPPADTSTPTAARTMPGTNLGVGGAARGGLLAGYPIPNLGASSKFPALPPNTTNNPGVAGPGYTTNPTPPLPANARFAPGPNDSLVAQLSSPADRPQGILAQFGGGAPAAPAGGIFGTMASGGTPPDASPAPAASAAAPPSMLSPSPARRPVPPMPMQAQAAGNQPLISPQQLVDTYNAMRKIPSAQASANAALQALMKMAPEGFQLMPDGSARLMPGIAAGKGAIKGAESDAANASDLRYKPETAGRTKAAELPSVNAAEGYKAEQQRITEGAKPMEVGPDKDIVYPPGTPGAMNYRNAQMRGELPDNVTLLSNGGVRVTGGNAGTFGKEVAQLNAKQLLERRAVALDAAKSIENTAETRELLKGVGDIPGTGATFSLALNKAMTALGYPDARVANTEAFIATRAAEVGRLIKQFGSGTGLSDADRAYATKMAAGDITLNKDSITRILDITERASRNIISEHNKEASKIPPGLSPYPLTVDMPAAAGKSGVTPSGVRWSVQ